MKNFGLEHLYIDSEDHKEAELSKFYQSSY